MSERFWKILLLIVVIGKTIEFSYRFYKWYKNKKNKNS